MGPHYIMAKWREKRIKHSDVVAQIKRLCGDPPKPRVSLLIGSGCSVTAGIPTAGTIVEDYLKPHPLLKNVPPCPAGVSEYAYLMGQLPPNERMEIIESCIKQAQNDADPPRTRVNWAHLLIATLVHHGYVKQILTTNFDPLLVDAMAMTDQPVRTFDITASDFFNSLNDEFCPYTLASLPKLVKCLVRLNGKASLDKDVSAVDLLINEKYCRTSLFLAILQLPECRVEPSIPG